MNDLVAPKVGALVNLNRVSSGNSWSLTQRSTAQHSHAVEPDTAEHSTDNVSHSAASSCST
jgi:hypothetical protein